MSLVQKAQQLVEEEKSKKLKEFGEELFNLSRKYNIFMRPIIEREGPKFEYFSLTEEELNKINNELLYDDKTSK